MVDIRSQAARPDVLPVQVRVVLALARAVEVLVPPLVQLHPLAIELLLHDERPPLHFLHALLDPPRRPLAEHRREGTKELDGFVLSRILENDQERNQSG